MYDQKYDVAFIRIPEFISEFVLWKKNFIKINAIKFSLSEDTP